MNLNYMLTNTQYNKLIQLILKTNDYTKIIKQNFTINFNSYGFKKSIRQVVVLKTDQAITSENSYLTMCINNQEYQMSYKDAKNILINKIYIDEFNHLKEFTLFNDYKMTSMRKMTIETYKVFKSELIFTKDYKDLITGKASDIIYLNINTSNVDEINAVLKKANIKLKKELRLS